MDDKKRINELIGLIEDGKRLGFNGRLIEEYRKQLRELREGVKGVSEKMDNSQIERGIK